MKKERKVYYSVDPEAVGEESSENQRKLIHFLEKEGYLVYRAPYVFSDDPDLFLQKELGLNRKPTYAEQREAHLKWIDDADILVADVSAPSEGRSAIIQRALDKPKMGLPPTKIILIKAKRINRKFGKIMQGLIESGKVVYFEYDQIEEVISNWRKLTLG